MGLRRIREKLRDGKPPRAANTIDAYRTAWRQFVSWCARAGKEHLPTSVDTASMYVTWLLVEKEKAANTAIQHLSAICHHHREAKVNPPDMKEARNVISAVRRDRRERPRQATAIKPMDLLKISRACGATTKRGLRDRAMVVLGFASGLRRSEIARLQLADVTFEKKGIAVLIRHSKTDQDAHGRVIGVWAGKRPATDPIRVLRAWLRVRGKWPGPIFCRIQTHDVLTLNPISGEAVNEAFQRAVRLAGLDPAGYSAHSLRAGAITAAAELGRSDQEIMDLSGHETPEVMRSYIRHARVFSGRNPLAGAL